MYKLGVVNSMRVAKKIFFKLLRKKRKGLRRSSESLLHLPGEGLTKNSNEGITMRDSILQRDQERDFQREGESMASLLWKI